MQNAKTCFGSFNELKQGSYTITASDKLDYAWEYIYQNPQILLRVDQYGLVNCQYLPPQDIMLFKREPSDRYSKWNTAFFVEGEIGTLPAFAFPNAVTSYFGYPQGQIDYSPECATYCFDYGNFSLSTTVSVPIAGAEVIVKTTFKNKKKAPVTVRVCPLLYPYVNHSQITPWDKYEWYLKTGAAVRENKLVFNTKLFSSKADPLGRRHVAFTVDSNDKTSLFLSLEKFVEKGDFCLPSAFKKKDFAIAANQLRNKAGDWDDSLAVFGYPPVYAANSYCQIPAEGEKSFTSILNVFSGEDFNYVEHDKILEMFSDSTQKKQKVEVENFYADLFSKRKICSQDKMFDQYVNSFMPLQMHWVSCLDRGWPTGMRGVRDASNDFMGMLPLDSIKARETILQIAECQRTDGWFPRQVSVSGRSGNHDFRNFCDGGAFYLEFLCEYINYTRDYAVLSEQIAWVDCEQKSSLFQHVSSALAYYENNGNIGEHGLVKIWGGDWLDSVNRAGNKGVGESVMTSFQLISILPKIVEVLYESVSKNPSVPISWGGNSPLNDFVERAEIAVRRLLMASEAAYNEHGFYSSVFNDDRKWLFSSEDPDGVERVYGPVNYWSIISGAASCSNKKTIWKNIEKLRYPFGYKLFSAGLGAVPIPNHGRMASGDIPIGLWANNNMYNHGSHGFLCRALAVAKKPEELFDALMYLLPFSQKHHPVEQTLSAPYAIVNCYQNIPAFSHRAAMPFLTGTIAYALRIVYNWLYGIEFCPKGLCISPCISKNIGDSMVSFTAFDKPIVAKFIYNGVNEKASGEVYLNDTIVTRFYIDPATKCKKPLILAEELSGTNNKIEVRLKNGTL